MTELQSLSDCSWPYYTRRAYSASITCYKHLHITTKRVSQKSHLTKKSYMLRNISVTQLHNINLLLVTLKLILRQRLLVTQQSHVADDSWWW